MLGCIAGGIVWGCGEAGPQPAVPAASKAPSESPDAAAPERRPEARASSLAPGRMRVLSLLQGVTLQANQVERERVLRELSSRAVFDLELGAMPARKLDLDLVNAPMPVVIARVLEGVPYSVDYETSEKGRHRLVWLSAGVFPEAETSGEQQTVDRPNARERKPGPQAARRQYLRWLSQRFRETGGFEARLEADARAREAEQEAIERLADGDESARIQALQAIDADGPGVRSLSQAALADGSASVRLEAVRALGDADSYEATHTLLGALRDPSSEVVAEALRQLGDAYDPSVLAHFPEGLREHDDAGVREAYAELLEELAP